MDVTAERDRGTQAQLSHFACQRVGGGIAGRRRPKTGSAAAPLLSLSLAAAAVVTVQPAGFGFLQQMKKKLAVATGRPISRPEKRADHRHLSAWRWRGWR